MYNVNQAHLPMEEGAEYICEESKSVNEALPTCTWFLYFVRSVPGVQNDTPEYL